MAKRQKRAALVNEPESGAKEVVTQFALQLPESSKTPSQEGLSELDFLVEIHGKLPREFEIRELVTDLLNCELSSEQITRLARIRQVGESFPVGAPIIGAQIEQTLGEWLGRLTDHLGSDGLSECRRYQTRIVEVRSRIKSALGRDWSDPEYVATAWRHSLSLLESSDEFSAPIGHTSKLIASINSGEGRKELERLFSNALREAKQQPNGLRQELETNLRIVRDALSDFVFEALTLAETGFVHSTTRAVLKHGVVRESEGLSGKESPPQAEDQSNSGAQHRIEAPNPTEYQLDRKWLTSELCQERFELNAKTLSRWATSEKGCPHLGGRKVKRAKFPPEQNTFCYCLADVLLIKQCMPEDDE